MSRCLTLEEYLERFVDENTQPAGEEVTLMVTDEQAQTLGHFFINGLAGFVAYVRLEQTSPQGTELSGAEELGKSEMSNESDPDEFIN